MIIHRFRDCIRVDTPAKLNLFLEVLARRSDGFHDIESLIVPISRFDTLWFSEAERESTYLECSWAGGFHARQNRAARRRESDLLAGKDNLVWRAIDLLRAETQSRRGIRVCLRKRIPAAAGLGGGSSDAAATLWAVNQLWQLELSLRQLAELGARLGSDIPFFLGSGPAICRGRGEQLDRQRGLARLPVVVARPADGLSTAEVYRACQPAGQPACLAPLLEALRRGNPSAIGRHLVNRLQPAAEQLTTSIARLREAFTRCDVVGHQMSGSGTSYFGICRSARHARRVSSWLRGHGIGDVFAAFTMAPQAGFESASLP